MVSPFLSSFRLFSFTRGCLKQLAAFPISTRSRTSPSPFTAQYWKETYPNLKCPVTSCPTRSTRYLHFPADLFPVPVTHTKIHRRPVSCPASKFSFSSAASPESTRLLPSVSPPVFSPHFSFSRTHFPFSKLHADPTRASFDYKKIEPRCCFVSLSIFFI